MRQELWKAVSIMAASIAVASCGGGGGDAAPAPINGAPTPVPAPTPTPTPTPTPAPSPSPTAAPPATGNPTSALSASQSAAANLAGLAQTGATSVLQAGGLSGVPIGVIATPPNAVTTSGTVNCPVSGSYNYQYDFALSNGTLSSGDTWSSTYTSCSFAVGTVVNGAIEATYSRYNGPADFALDIAVTNYSFLSNNFTYGPYTYSAHYDFSGGAFAYSYTVSGSTVVGQPTVTLSGTTAQLNSGVLHATYGSGWVSITYTNWSFDSVTGHPTAGSVTVLAANGDSATIDVTSTGYNVSITVSGVTTTYVVPFAS